MGHILGVSDADRDKWDRKHAERGAPGEPSPWLLSLDPLLPRRGRALDVAGGAGRNAVWLARRGLDVTLVDVSPVGLAIARAQGAPLTTLALDLEREPLPPGPFDVVLCFHFLDRRVWRELPLRLAPGGLLVVCHPTRENLARHAHPSADYLLEPGELPRLLASVETVVYEEGWLDEGRHEARFVGRLTG
jgi:tellurite methyltransferase